MVSEEIALTVGGKALGVTLPLAGFGPIGWAVALTLVALHEASKASDRRCSDDD